MGQKFYADTRTNTFAWPNGAIGFRTGAGAYDCLGPYAKVQNCPVMVGDKEMARLTCYATNYADTFFSIPACTRYRGKYVRGYFTLQNEEGGSVDGACVFRVMDSHKHLFAKYDQEWISMHDPRYDPTVDC